MSAKLSEIINGCSPSGEVTVVVGGFPVSVKPRLTLAEMSAFVKAVVNGCFDDEGEFSPELRDVYERLALIELYTDIEVDADSEENFGSLAYSCPELFDAVYSSIDAEQYTVIEEAIDSRLRREEQLLRKERDKFIAEVDAFSERSKGFFDEMAGLDLKGLIPALNKLSPSGVIKANLDKKVKTQTNGGKKK